MMTREPFRFSLICLAVSAAIAVAGCSKKKDTTPPVATPSLTLSHERAPAGSPLELMYKFVVPGDAHFGEDYRVFVHVVDTDEEQMWTDDHNPPVPTSEWKPGQTVEYSRTIFVPVFPYVGDATIQMGLHSTKDQKRLTLAGEDVGQHSYKVAKLQLLPQTDNLFTVFKDGWNPAEAPAQDASVEWQWTKKQATLAFKNPKKDATLYFDADSPEPKLHSAQHVQISLGGQVVEDYTLEPDTRALRKIKLPGALMGSADLSELQITVDPTFVPMTVTNGASKDPRELGIRVFHAYVDPR
jgi:hypothetical protein